MFLYEKEQHELRLLKRRHFSFFNLKLRDLEFRKSEADFKVSALNWHCDTTLDRNAGMGTNMYSQPPTQRDGSLSLSSVYFLSPVT